MTTGDAPDVLRAAVERYAALGAYSDTGEVMTRIAATGTVHRITFSTLYQRPSFFRFTFFNPHPHPPLGHLVTEHSVGYDGTVGYSVAKRPDGAVDRKSPISLEAAVARATGISSGSAHTIGRLLLPKVHGLGLLDLVDAHRGDDVLIEGKSCYSVTARSPKGYRRQEELWIEKDSYLLRRRITRSGQSESVEARENISIDSPQPNSLFVA
jgi:hypothetical protein